MQQSTIALIERYYAAFNAGDITGMLVLLADNVVHDINQGARETGQPAFRAFLERLNACYRERLTDIVVMSSPDGARAGAEFTVRGEYLRTDEGLPPARGQKYALPAGAFFEVRDERIVRVTTYYNLADWIAQVRR